MIKLKVSEEKLLWWYVNNGVSLYTDQLRMFLEKDWKSYIEYNNISPSEEEMFKEYFEEELDYRDYIGKLCVFSNDKINDTSSVDIGILNIITDDKYISNNLKKYSYCMLSTEYELLLNNSKICSEEKQNNGWIKDALLKVKDKIESEPHNFEMSDWINKSECGTTHCIGGWLQNITNDKIVVYRPNVDDKIDFTYNTMPDINGMDMKDYHSALFACDEWYKFISYETTQFICKYAINNEVTFDADEFDYLPNDVKIEMACMVIDDYINQFL